MNNFNYPQDIPQRI